jgi:hypothetical protein
VAKAALWACPDAEARKLGERTGLTRYRSSPGVTPVPKPAVSANIPRGQRRGKSGSRMRILDPVETARRPPTQVGVMTQSDLTGNSERSSEMTVRHDEELWSVPCRNKARESNRRVDTLVVPAVNVGC